MENPQSTESKEAGKRRKLESDERSRTVMCMVVSMDTSNFCYRVCSICERTLPEEAKACCNFCKFRTGVDPGSKRLFRLLLRVATFTEIFEVICFDRAARVLFGCSADEFLDFLKLNPNAAVTADEILERDLFEMTLSKPKNGNAQHLRVATVKPMRSCFRSVIDTLRQLHRVTLASSRAPLPA
ncbi:hypothetical protein RJ641_008442 [Dillenia turbinata]|uniref:Replication factor A C-terminal domain-containing protein n=1 Tax=Dillenia turbinata TaxID=194707 RepID=A0AAN8V1E0_9MAGN